MPTILIADDEKDIRELIETFLRIDGYDVIAASTGEEVVLKARREKVDAILLDYSMPLKSGLDACREIKADPACCGVPVAFLSARSQDNEIRAGLDAGASIFLVKPFSMAQLSDCVRALLSKAA